MNDTRYIVVAFNKGIGYTLLTDDKPHVFFDRHAKVYKNLASAVKRASKLSYQYINDKVCVFKVELGELLSCAEYKGWYKNEERLVFDTSK